LIAISRLALLAAFVGEGDAPVHAVLDAGRGEFYYGEYAGHRCVRESLMSQEKVSAAVAGGGLVMVCEAKVAEMLSAVHPRLVDEPSAGDALPLALERIAASEFDDVSLLDANYLRRTDAEIFAKPKAKSAV
jgi:tRNA threonylcarbamoyladenosine biosynthesis protein TsaB